MNDCKQCEYSRINWLGDIGCLKLKDWITHTEYKTKKVLDDCPKSKEAK